MAVVSADTRRRRRRKTAAKPPSAAKPDAVAPPSRSPTATSPGQTVTIIDGSTGKRQEVTVGSRRARAKKNCTEDRRQARDQAGRADRSRACSRPRVMARSRRSRRTARARPRSMRAPSSRRRPRRRAAHRDRDRRARHRSERHRRGAGEAAAPVTFAFTPYGTDLERWVARARGEGHEVLLQIGMEPFDYPDNDPGPQTLLDLASRPSRTSTACTGSSAAFRAMSASPA